MGNHSLHNWVHSKRIHDQLVRTWRAKVTKHKSMLNQWENSWYTLARAQNVYMTNFTVDEGKSEHNVKPMGKQLVHKWVSSKRIHDQLVRERRAKWKVVHKKWRRATWGQTVDAGHQYESSICGGKFEKRTVQKLFEVKVGDQRPLSHVETETFKTYTCPSLMGKNFGKIFHWLNIGKVFLSRPVHSKRIHDQFVRTWRENRSTMLSVWKKS